MSNNRPLARASIRALNQSFRFDVRQHFPTYKEYEAHRLADSVQASTRQPVVLSLKFAR